MFMDKIDEPVDMSNEVHIYNIYTHKYIYTYVYTHICINIYIFPICPCQVPKFMFTQRPLRHEHVRDSQSMRSMINLLFIIVFINSQICDNCVFKDSFIIFMYI